MGGRSENGHHDSVPGSPFAQFAQTRSRRRRLRAAPCLGCGPKPAAEKTRPLYRFSKVRSRKALLCTRRLSANSRQRQRCREKAASVPTNAEKCRVLYQHAAAGGASRNVPVVQRAGFLGRGTEGVVQEAGFLGMVPCLRKLRHRPAYARPGQRNRPGRVVAQRKSPLRATCRPPRARARGSCRGRRSPWHWRAGTSWRSA